MDCQNEAAKMLSQCLGGHNELCHPSTVFVGAADYFGDGIDDDQPRLDFSGLDRSDQLFIIAGRGPKVRGRWEEREVNAVGRGSSGLNVTLLALAEAGCTFRR